MVVDGYAVTLNVERGHLVVRDGVADQRRERAVSRVDPHLARIVILADTGTVSLDAIRWCADLNITLTQVDRTGRTLFTALPPGRDDARLRRTQAAAAGTPVAASIARELLSAKLASQAQVAGELLGEFTLAQAIQDRASELDNVQSIHDMRALEAKAAADYFAACTRNVRASFATRDRGRVPAHWQRFDGRRPPRRGASTFAATNPVNALLNYLYALAETEARRACLILGLDPGLGFIHADKKARDSLALDLLEPVRPHVDAWLLTLLRARTFTRTDFHETRDGTCRVLAPLTHELAATLPAWAHAVAPHAEAVAHTLAEAAAAPIGTPTPLTGRKHRAGARAVTTRITPPARTCPECGSRIAARAKRCGPCWQAIQQAQMAANGFTAAQAALAAARKAGDDPAHGPAARQRRGHSFRVTSELDRAWDREHPHAHRTPDTFRQDIRPGLQGVPLAKLVEATGLSQAACSLIRSGKQVPHPRHWNALAQVSQRALGTGGHD